MNGGGGGLYFYRPRGNLILRSMEKPTNKFQGEANIKDKLKVRSGSRRVTGSHQPSVKLFHAMLWTGVNDPAKKSRKSPEVLGVLASLSSLFPTFPSYLRSCSLLFPLFFWNGNKTRVVPLPFSTICRAVGANKNERARYICSSFTLRCSFCSQQRHFNNRYSDYLLLNITLEHYRAVQP